MQKVLEWMTNARKKRNEKSDSNHAAAIDSLMNFETVKYFNAEKYEIQRFQDDVKHSQRFKWKADLFSDFCDFLNNFVYNGGFLTGYLIIAHMISDGTKTVGRYTKYWYILRLDQEFLFMLQVITLYLVHTFLKASALF